MCESWRFVRLVDESASTVRGVEEAPEIYSRSAWLGYSEILSLFLGSGPEVGESLRSNKRLLQSFLPKWGSALCFSAAEGILVRSKTATSLVGTSGRSADRNEWVSIEVRSDPVV